MLEGLDDALAGMSAGETKDVRRPRWPAATAQGQEADVTVTVQSVKERELPELDDDFAQLASEFDTLDELRGRPARAGARSQEDRAGRAGPRQGCSSAARGRRHPGARRRSSRPRCTRHLEGEDRLEDDEHRAEVSEQATQGAADPVPARRHRREAEGVRSASPS